ncbi:uncharacterized protein [Rutidosis leptorrhynchoides]|uniref:uncharacterized protein n=1 Tax=Rutidosis leptorrhynchoides TaxID=125765 RepID=UPI003A9A56DF
MPFYMDSFQRLFICTSHQGFETPDIHIMSAYCINLYMALSMPLVPGFSALQDTLGLVFTKAAMARLFLFIVRDPIQHLYVDDIVLTASSTCLLQRIISSLHKEFAMTDLGPLNYFLGIHLTRTTSGMFLSQKQYAHKIIERARMPTCHPCRTPVEPGAKLTSHGPPFRDPTLYRSLAGALHYMPLLPPPWLPILTLIVQVAPLPDDLPPAIVFFLVTTFSHGHPSGKPLPLAPVLKQSIVGLPMQLQRLVGSIYLSSNLVQHQWTKHIEIDIHFVRDLAAQGQDIFLKPLQTSFLVGNPFKFIIGVLTSKYMPKLKDVRYDLKLILIANNGSVVLLLIRYDYVITVD